ncbi:MAG: shikimate kinase [Chloroflexota bacterium]
MGDITLIGPGKAGKTAVGRLLAERLGRPFYNLGADAGRYHEAHGISWDDARRAWEQGRFEGWYGFMRPFEALAVEKALAEHAGQVVELGALQIAYDDEAHAGRVRDALRGHSTVLLLPSADREEAARVLEERQRFTYRGQDINEYFVRHPANESLARQTVYTHGRTPEQTVEDVLAALDPADETVVLIGPIGTGKSTVGKLLAERLGRQQLAVDKVRWEYYKEIGWSEEEQRRIAEQGGAEAMLDYWKPFEVHAVERILAEHRGKVIDFGAGHSVYEQPEHMERARAALAPFRNVVLLLPSPDKDESVAILRDRMTDRIDGSDLNRYLLAHRLPRELATITVYTAGKTPEQTAEEILGRLAAG